MLRGRHAPNSQRPYLSIFVWVRDPTAMPFICQFSVTLSWVNGWQEWQGHHTTFESTRITLHPFWLLIWARIGGMALVIPHWFFFFFFPTLLEIHRYISWCHCNPQPPMPFQTLKSSGWQNSFTHSTNIYRAPNTHRDLPLISSRDTEVKRQMDSGV